MVGNPRNKLTGNLGNHRIIYRFTQVYQRNEKEERLGNKVGVREKGKGRKWLNNAVRFSLNPLSLSLKIRTRREDR